MGTTISKKAFALIILLILFLPPRAEADSNDSPRGFGPVQFSNGFPIAVSQLTVQPEGPAVLGGAGILQTRSVFSWSNTYNDELNLRIDSESRSLLQSFTLGVSDSTDISLLVPVHWRGGGVLDSSIDHWHSWLGLPRGGRDEVKNNDFRLSGQNDDESFFFNQDDGLGVGDLSLSVKSLWPKNTWSVIEEFDIDLASSLTVQLPSGADRYSNDGVEVMFETFAAKELTSVILYAGVGYAFSSADNYQGAAISRHRPGGFVSVEYPLCKSSTIGASYLISTHPNEPVRAIPRTEQYLDLFYIREAQGIGRFEVGLRENPVSGNTTTDFTLLVAFTRNWGQVF